MSGEVERATVNLGRLVVDQHTLIGTALSVYVDHMRGAARQAREEYERGRSDPAVKAAQDASLLTNRCLRLSAEMFDEAADRAVRAVKEIAELVQFVEGDDG